MTSPCRNSWSKKRDECSEGCVALETYQKYLDSHADPIPLSIGRRSMNCEEGWSLPVAREIMEKY